MRKGIIILFCVFLTACHSVKIDKESFDVTNNNVELGSIGNARASFMKNSFESNAFPILENKIRLNTTVVPFTKKTAKSYLKKNKYNQEALKLNYIDSLDVKPEMVIIRIADKLGYISELNESYNEKVSGLIATVSDLKVVSSLAVFLSNEELAKVKQSDACYLANNQDKKYSIVLYTEGKRTGSLELKPNRIFGYQTSAFCWTSNGKGKWYIADMVNAENSCQGKSVSKLKEETKEESLYKM